MLKEADFAYGKARAALMKAGEPDTSELSANAAQVPRLPESR